MDAPVTPKAVIRFLLDPGNYPEKPAGITHIETHISHVFVGDTHVYKIKKPVSFGFLDFSSLEKRHHFCKKELLLNRRLARDIYLSVEPIFATDKGYSFSPKTNSRPVEWAVKMKKIPMDCLLFLLITEGRPLYGELEEVGRMLALFHYQLPPYRGTKMGGIDNVIASTSENFEHIRTFCGTEIQERTYTAIKEYTRSFVAEKAPLFGERRANGFVRNGHGDLHCEHICLSRPPVIFDCIEFNDSFRIIDILQDIAFLFMDMEYRGRFDLTSCLFSSYFGCWPEALNDDLLMFYKVYRAVVRGKVEALTARNVAEEGAQQVARVKGRNYFDLAEYYIKYALTPFNPIVFMGLSGSGKSTIARRFSPDVEIVRSDEVRKDSLGLSRDTHAYSPVGEGVYDPALTQQIYCALLDKAVGHGKAGRKVIVDATYLKAKQRKHFYDSSMAKGLNPFFVHCFASEDTLRNRITQRMQEGKDISDAHLAVLEHQLKHLEEPDELPSFRVLKINTEDALNNIVSALKQLL